MISDVTKKGWAKTCVHVLTLVLSSPDISSLESSVDPDQLASDQFIQASMSKIQGFFKDFSRLSYSFQGLKVYERS